MNKAYLLCFSLLIIHTFSLESLFDLVMLNSTSALCLDGTPAGFYISQNGDPKKIYINFQGGGWCG
jgi:hypothetical protein